MSQNHQSDDTQREPYSSVFQWFAEKILPAVLMAITIAVANMYVEHTSLKHSTAKYRQATRDLREKDAKAESKQWSFIKNLGESVARLEERCVSKDKFYEHKLKDKNDR